MASLFLEAESFDSLGGWVVDSRSMLQMGSAYVMAHGMGVPVRDAETTCTIPESGRWTVWGRTRDWTAVWKRGNPAGIFQIKINGVTLPQILGTNGSAWAWQKAGTVELDAGNAEIALHDLSGFNGRCDALYLTTDPAEIPPDGGKELEEFRKRKSGIICQDDPDFYDLIVAGGGVAGMCTALAATRTGSKVLLLQDRPVLGGCNSSEIRVVLGGLAHTECYPNLGRTLDEFGPIIGGPYIAPAEEYEDYRKEHVFKLHSEDRCKVLLNECVVGLEKDPSDSSKIVSLISRSTLSGKEKRFRGRLFADCTGDAVIARMAGAEVMYGTEGRAKFNESLAPEEERCQVMGHSVLWQSRKTETPSSFPDIDWGIPFDEKRVYYLERGYWEWESGQYRNQADDAEYIRDYGLMTIFANWSYLKNHSARREEWANKELVWVSAIGGKRESYRVVGDYIMTQHDIERTDRPSDGTGGGTWSIDLHYPDPENEELFGEPFRSCAYHRGVGRTFQVPYRCLYARDVKNLFLGGRHISASHVAFSCVRVMRTLGILGEVIGMAASLCREENAYPRDIYETHFDKLKTMMEKGVPIPWYFGWVADDQECYHFSEAGFIHLDPSGDPNRIDDKLLKRIRSLKIQHKKHDPAFDDRNISAAPSENLRKD